jgi:hypothetical protein
MAARHNRHRDPGILRGGGGEVTGAVHWCQSYVTRLDICNSYGTDSVAGRHKRETK